MQRSIFQTWKQSKQHQLRERFDNLLSIYSDFCGKNRLFFMSINITLQLNATTDLYNINNFGLLTDDSKIRLLFDFLHIGAESLRPGAPTDGRHGTRLEMGLLGDKW